MKGRCGARDTEPVRYGLALTFQEQISAHWNGLHVNQAYADVCRSRVRVDLYRPKGGRNDSSGQFRAMRGIASSPMAEQWSGTRPARPFRVPK